MAKLLMTTCAALFLFSVIAASPIKLPKNVSCNVTQQIILQLQDLKKLPENTLFVPKVKMSSEGKNVPIEEIACRAVKSLATLSNTEKKPYAELIHSLQFFSHKVKNCTVDSENLQGLQGFVTELLSLFQEYYFNDCKKHKNIL